MLNSVTQFLVVVHNKLLEFPLLDLRRVYLDSKILRYFLEIKLLYIYKKKIRFQKTNKDKKVRSHHIRKKKVHHNINFKQSKQRNFVQRN